jgi:5-methylcytosine-specific restriction endonuclease McrA
MQSPEAQSKAVAKMRELRASGLVRYNRGPDNPTWKGGQKATVKRWIESGKANEQLRRYRAANQHRAREWAQNRRHRKHGKLPYGTIPKMGRAQNWKCAICRTSIKDAYHVDHIMPIARGGKHEPRNIQLLCETCNVRKNAKDPIAYMQELGRLL